MLEKLKGEQASVLLLHTDYKVEQQLLLGADCCQRPCQWCGVTNGYETSEALLVLAFGCEVGTCIVLQVRPVEQVLA